MRCVWFVFTCVLCSTLSLHGADRFDLDRMMPIKDQKAAGVDTLEPQQRRALESWIDLWTVRALNTLLDQGCDCSADECLSSIYEGGEGSRGSSRRRSSARNDRYSDERQSDDRYYERSERRSPGRQALKDAQDDQIEITSINRGGARIRLKDGSNWEVDQKDRATASRWQRGEKVQVLSGREYGYLTLYNVSRRQKIDVRAPNDETRRQADPFGRKWAEQERDATVTRITDEGKTLILDNGRVYEISFGDARRYARHWRPGTVVQVTHKGGIYPYSIANTSNGETVEARIKK